MPGAPEFLDLLVGSNQERVAHEGRAKPGHVQLGDVHADAKCVDCDGAVCHNRRSLRRRVGVVSARPRGFVRDHPTGLAPVLPVRPGMRGCPRDAGAYRHR